MKRFFPRKRYVTWRQRGFNFLERSRCRQNRFKMAILAGTCIALVLPFVALPQGRYAAARVPSLARQTIRGTLGIAVPRNEIDDNWRRRRLRGISDSRTALPTIYAKAGPDMQRLMRYAGLDPDHGLLRWGNYDSTLLLPGTIFEADDNGRSYRLRPCTDSIWLREVSIESGVLMFFLVPDGPGLATAIKGTPAIPVSASRQSTNSWGLRGPEPDLAAPVRGLVLGDSFMQGLFVGDEDTPPECLRRDLERRLESRVSILNTGHMGYSPEQYYFSLVEYGDRFRPQFVVVSLFANDFASDVSEVVMRGKADWDEARYWLEQIIEFCRARQWTYLVVPIPYEPLLLGRRKAGHYPGTISNILQETGLTFLDPSDDLINAHLDLIVASERNGTPPAGCPLYNTEIGDGHFSALGSRAWAEIVGRRLALLLREKLDDREGETRTR